MTEIDEALPAYRALRGYDRKRILALRPRAWLLTRPYAWIAQGIGRPGAVGSALARNPVPVLIPCHRVTRSDGQPGDYVFGMQVKEALLRAEEVNLDEVRKLARARIFYLGSDATGIVCLPYLPPRPADQPWTPAWVPQHRSSGRRGVPAMPALPAGCGAAGMNIPQRRADEQQDEPLRLGRG